VQTPAPSRCPRRLVVRQEAPRADVLHHARGAVGVVPLAAGDRTLGAVERLRGHLDVDPSVVRQLQLEHAAALDRRDPAQLREQGA